MMAELVVQSLLWVCAIGCGLIGGLFFAFSTFVMRALGTIGQVPGILAMNAINSTILRSLFMPIFLATTVAAAALGIVAVVRWGDPGAMAMLGAGLSYVIGMFGCTMLFNVPLNNALAAVDPASPEAANVWERYLREWTLWNHVRTVASLAAAALSILALEAQS
jgi:uncharacterized membrane protein